MKQASHRFNPLEFIHPRYWPTWLGIGLLRLSVFLPSKIQMALGRAVGKLVYKLLAKRRHIAEINVRLCFPELSDSERDEIVRKTFENNGIALFETAMAWWASEKRLKKLCNISGLEHIHEQLGEGRGVLLLSAHFSTLEISGAMIACYQPFQVTYKKARNSLFEAVVKQSRERKFINAIDTYDVRRISKTLKEGLVTWYAADQDFGISRSVFVPFMGVNTCTLTTPSRYARMSNAAVVPYFPIRDENGCYQIKILPALENFPSESLEEDAIRINQLIEEYVRKAPDQYFWVHRRFKTRPEGEASLY
jgi:KDO2-lipid IV(A) lauroyltransferase